MREENYAALGNIVLWVKNEFLLNFGEWLENIGIVYSMVEYWGLFLKILYDKGKFWVDKKNLCIIIYDNNLEALPIIKI